jgi:MoxR-like ATPase
VAQPQEEIRLAAEVRYRDELEALASVDSFPKPPGWLLSPRMVEVYILGSADKVKGPKGPIPILPKYVGSRALVQVAIGTLASDRALLLVGEPGTAKSWLSEHLSAAICGTSQYLVQGTSGTTEDQIKYSWNYAMLVAKGPIPEALVPSPLYRAMREGKVARFEEVTRVTSEIQDALISILSEKNIAVPELHQVLSARRGFNMIATANTRDRGVNEMSSALKRRFNFVTIPVVNDLAQEMAIVQKRVAELSQDYEVRAQVPERMVEMMVTMFEELRTGSTKDGKVKVKTPSTVLSTAEAISVLFNSKILGQHFRREVVDHEDLARSMIGAVAKEKPEDREVFAEYLENVVKGRGSDWRRFYDAALRALRE